MAKWLLNPPIAFMIIFLASWLGTILLSRLSFRSNKPEGDSTKSYACGEDTYNHMVQPDYSLFFPFAFFFTLGHVATLIVTTLSVVSPQTICTAVLYAFGAIIGLYILFRS